MDNTDNTKELTLDYSQITTGTERTQAYQDKDGTLALLDVENDGSLYAENFYTRGFDRNNPDTMPDVTYSAIDQTLSVAVKSGQSSFHLWSGGTKYTFTTTQTVQWTDASEMYYFYFDTDGVLQFAKHSDINSEIFLNVAICGLCYYNKTEGTVWGAPDEMHGIGMSPNTHFRLHMVEGFKHSTGGDITGLVDASSTYTGISSAIHFDEDIFLTSSASTTHKFMYREGADGLWKLTATADNNVGYSAPSGNTYWNEWTGNTWQLTESASDTDYIIYYFLKTNLDGDAGLVKIVGQQVYPSRSDARDALKYELHSIKLDGLSSQEAEFQYAYIVKKNGTIEDDAKGHAYVDLRGININSI